MIFGQNWIVEFIVMFLTAIAWCSTVEDADLLHLADETYSTKSSQENKQNPTVFMEEMRKSPSYNKNPAPTTSRTSSFDFTGIIGDEASTHAGWIQLDHRSYKIYNDIISYNSAMQRCINHHPDAQLAVVTSFKHSQILGTHLLLGKPRLANAWIGARWYNEGYQFEAEPLILPNISDSTGYPPWKYKKIEKSETCILLDRHILPTITIFLEANCIRLRPYICYIENNTGFTDLIRGDHAYRLHYNKRNWTDARNYCRDVYVNYSAHLAEIREPVQLYDLFHLMRQSESAVHRVWLGGIFNKSASIPTWLWDSDNAEVEIGAKTSMKWVKNSLYESPNKSDDSCIAMDNSEMNYAMACKFEQSYVCQFSVESLKKLQDDEKKTKPTYFKSSSKLGEQLKNYKCLINADSCRRPPDYMGLKITNKSSPFLTWIQADQKLYKIFNEQVSYSSAKQKCLAHHPDVELAVVPSINHADILGRHILTSRLILKAAWIGARWIDNMYQFESEPIKLPNASDTTGYPPWSSKEIQIKGCIALDQHGLKGPLFVESRCQHKRPYICYTENGTGFTDLIIGELGYRLYHNKKRWGDARNYCSDVYVTHSAHLVEIKEPIHMYYLSKLMEKHGSATRHVWLGGKLYKMGFQTSWFWDNSCEKISMESDSSMNWDNSTTYLSSMNDNCIAMDIAGKSYGTACEYELNYVCQFSAESLRFLQREEKTRKN